jgi:hypothetical protein
MGRSNSQGFWALPVCFFETLLAVEFENGQGGKNGSFITRKTIKKPEIFLD